VPRHHVRLIVPYHRRLCVLTFDDGCEGLLGGNDRDLLDCDDWHVLDRGHWHRGHLLLRAHHLLSGAHDLLCGNLMHHLIGYLLLLRNHVGVF
jgi:hypothetical protein